MAWGIVYLHGVGQGVRSDDWYDALGASLDAHGVDIPKLQSPRVVRPDYVDLLNTPPTTSGREPRRTPKETGGADERRRRQAGYSRSQAEAVADLPGLSTDRGWGGLGHGLGPDTMPGWAFAELEDARRYLADTDLRIAVLHRVIGQLGKQRDLVVIGHSLGSLVAVDLIGHLPDSVRVRRLITLGSPAGTGGIHKRWPDTLPNGFPFSRVAGWVNVHSPDDFVSRGLGLSGRFPPAQDVKIRLPMLAHAASRYLAHPAVAKLVADPLKPKRHSYTTSKSLSVPLDDVEREAIDAIMFGHLVHPHLKSDRSARFEDALAEVQRHTARTLIRGRDESSRPPARELEDLLALRTDWHRFAERPLDQELLFAIVCATNNPVAPYEIDIRKARMQAVRDLWVECGHSEQDARRVVAAIELAQDEFESSGVGRLLLGAAGLALLLAGPVGLLLAAPVGVAGGAAIVGALAAFGPGGMVGGMALAGGLVGVGSAVTTAAVSPNALTADMVQTQAVRLLAFARAQQQLGHPTDSPWAPWFTLNSWYTQLAEEDTRLSLYCDDDADVLKATRAKLRTVRKGLAWLVKHDLAPAMSS